MRSPACAATFLPRGYGGGARAASGGGGLPKLDAPPSQCSGRAMGRSLPKLIVLIAIGVVVAAIFVVTRRVPSTEPNVVYVNPGFSTPAPATPAPYARSRRL